MHVGISFVANFQASKGMKPFNRAFYDPTRFAQSAAMRRADFGKQGRDATFSQALTVRLETVAPVTLDNMRFMQGSAWFAANIWYRGYQCIKLGNVVPVRAAQDDLERDALCVDDEVRWCLLPSLRRSVGFGPSFFPQASRVRMNCRRWRAPGRAGRDDVARPAASRGCVARLRLLPCDQPSPAGSTREPQPISCDSRFQAMPERGTNTMPVSTARSGVGACPAYRRLRGARAGNNGSMTDHSSSMSSLAIASCRTKQGRKLTPNGKS
jgi:hypothetical protein